MPEATPGTSDELPQGIGIATTDGAFGIEELLLQQDQPTVLEMVNNDDPDGGTVSSGYIYWVQMYWVQMDTFVIRMRADVEGSLAEEGIVALVEAQMDCLETPEEQCASVSLPEEIAA